MPQDCAEVLCSNTVSRSNGPVIDPRGAPAPAGESGFASCTLAALGPAPLRGAKGSAERSLRGRFAPQGPYPFYWVRDTSRVNPAYRQGRVAALDPSLLKKAPRRVSGAGPNGRRSWRDLSTGGRAPLPVKVSPPGWRGEQTVRARQIAAQCCGSFPLPRRRSAHVIQ